MTESPRPGPAQPRGRLRLGAAVALGIWTLVWFFGLLGTGDAYAIVWYASGLLVCCAGLAVAVGRARAGSGDSWQAALVAAAASLLGPLSAALLVFPSMRRSLREARVQLRARGAELETLGHTPEQAAVARRQGGSLALGLVASTIAFWSGLFVGLWIGLSGGTLKDGSGVVFGLVIALVVGMVGFVGVLVVQRKAHLMAGLEQAAAAAMAAAIVCVALDGGDLRWSDGGRESVAFLYVVWALVAALFVWGAAIARRPAAAGSIAS